MATSQRRCDVRAIARTVTDAYLNGEVDRVLLVYPKFVSTVAQTPTVIQLLPVEPPEEAGANGADAAVYLRAERGQDLRGAAAALHRDADLPAAAGNRRQLLLGADGGDEERHR